MHDSPIFTSHTVPSKVISNVSPSCNAPSTCPLVEFFASILHTGDVLSYEIAWSNKAVSLIMPSPCDACVPSGSCAYSVFRGSASLAYGVRSSTQCGFPGTCIKLATLSAWPYTLALFSYIFTHSLLLWSIPTHGIHAGLRHKRVTAPRISGRIFLHGLEFMGLATTYAPIQGKSLWFTGASSDSILAVHSRTAYGVSRKVDTGFANGQQPSVGT